MDINKKIEEIRKKPEHVRERYLWIAVGVSMTIIFIAWMISIRTSFQKTSGENSDFDLMQKFDNAKNSLPENDTSTESAK